ncbi:hypothetical protein [Stenotrophomonas sp.]|uniref:hypothetical protein n=1 Tax=Stenotrophomonas sp. TaxID=69392 RepID=UPI002FC77EC2
MKIPMVMATALALCISLPSAATSSEHIHAGKTDIRAFFQAYLATGNDAVPSVQLPAIWIYSPAGHLVARIDSPTALDAVEGIMATPDAPAISTMRLAEMIGLMNRLGVDTGAGPDGSWTWLLLRSNACSQKCQPFHASIRSVQARHPGAIRAIDLAFTR